ncbi:RWD domain-containing protein 1 [Octopus bimaculoides]|nr:RWD domain-containing protein 1 [Octopus bimaculoides]|eukprot:XP_014785673.1 PREDICTED: RWD domain-containing protein 1-like [Octopus bimaculoides]
MTNHREEQRDEIEALEAIYPNEIKVLETEPNYIFAIELSSQLTEEEGEDLITMTLQFTLDDDYPDSIPIMEIMEFQNLDDVKVNVILEDMNELAQETLGMVMVFTIVSAVQEKINDIIEQNKQEREKEELRKQKEKEESEQKTFEGTRVTVETFIAWKARFDLEMKESNRNLMDINQSNTKLTGKELFQQDSSGYCTVFEILHSCLYNCIFVFFSENEAVEVDESLFQDIDELGLEDEDLED